MIDAPRAATRLPGPANDPSQAPENRRYPKRLPSLRARLVLVVALMSAVIYAAVTAPFRAIIWLNVNREAEAMLREQARLIQAMLPPDRAALDRTLSSLPLGVFSLQLIRTNGTERVKAGPLAGELPLPADFPQLVRSRGGSIIEETRTTSNQRIRVLTTSLADPATPEPEPLFLQLALSLEEKHQRLSATMGWFLIGGILVITLPAAAMLLLINQWRRQFVDLCATARAINPGTPLHQRLFVPTADADLAQLAGSFNALIERIEKTYATQQRFIADASHELRTPLTIIRGEIDVILRREREAADYREVMQSNKEEIEKLSRLVDNMLTLALADARETAPAKRPVHLFHAAESACKRLQGLAAERGVELLCSGENSVTVSGESSDLERAIFNLVENAIHHSPRGESVTVTVSSHNGHATVRVDDRGPGIQPQEIERIFDRFYRVDKARSRTHGGAGLGLAIVKTIVESHGGQVEAQSKPGAGATFRIRIPSAPLS